jgi:hypothetical protein
MKDIPPTFDLGSDDLMPDDPAVIGWMRNMADAHGAAH